LEKPDSMDDATFKRLKEVFELIDTDASGFIDTEEFHTLLKLQVSLLLTVADDLRDYSISRFHAFLSSYRSSAPPSTY
jgi:Ca2+-binding EF-hand superfamily protein